MTVTASNIIPSKEVEPTTAAEQYAAINCTTIIDKITVVNVTASAVSFTAYIVPAAGTAGADNIIISAKSIAPGETYQCPELVGQIMAPNSKIFAFASAASSLIIRGSGREIT